MSFGKFFKKKYDYNFDYDLAKSTEDFRIMSDEEKKSRFEIRENFNVNKAINKEIQLKDFKALVVDDVIYNSKWYRNLLQEEGVSEDNIVFARSAKEGLDAFKKSAFDLLLLDYNMGKHNGSYLLHELARGMDNGTIDIPYFPISYSTSSHSENYFKNEYHPTYPFLRDIDLHIGGVDRTQIPRLIRGEPNKFDALQERGLKIIT